MLNSVCYIYHMANTTNKTICKVGRSFDPAHVSCISCVKQLGACAEGKKTRRVTEAPRFWTRGDILVCVNMPLRSMNHWHGRPRYVYQSYKAEWRKILAGTWALWGKATGKRHLVITRYVASEGHLIKDADNRVGAAKPVKDLLVENGVLLDDTDNDVSFEVLQFIDKANPRTTIEII